MTAAFIAAGFGFALMASNEGFAQTSSAVCAPVGATCRPTPAVIIRSEAYPICFYDVEAGAVASAKEFWPEYSKRLSASPVAIAGKPNVQVLNSRSVIVRTSVFRHRQVAKMWPEVACVGTSGGDTSSRRRKTCVEFLKGFVDPGSKTARGTTPVEVIEPVCQMFLEAPGKS